MRAKGNAGEHLCTNPPYGYIKDPADKKKWIVDEDAAEIVKDVAETAKEAAKDAAATAEEGAKETAAEVKEAAGEVAKAAEGKKDEK